MKLLALILIYSALPICIAASAWFLVLKSKLTIEEKALIKKSRGVRGEIQAVLTFLALGFGIFGVFYYGINYSIIVQIPLLIVVGASEIFDLIHFLSNRSNPTISDRSRRAWIAPGILVLLSVAMIATGTIIYLTNA